MEVFEKINLILKEKSLTKREFAKKLIALEPKSSRTGETMTEKVIYTYLSGKTVINSNLIPYIAEALNIAEQELFTDSKTNRLKYLKYILKNPSEEELKLINNLSTNIPNNTKSKELVSLLPYIPDAMLESFIKKAKQVRAIL